MTSLRVLLVFFLATIAGTGLTIWSIVEYQNGNETNLDRALKILVIYEALVLISYGIVFIFLVVMNMKKDITSMGVELVEEPVSLDSEIK
jgi:cytochrome b subunit of formate dehydrogenase